MMRIKFSMLLLVVFFAAAGTQTTYAQSVGGLSNEGAGMYTDASVANQTSGFSINPRRVTCAVGTIDVNGDIGPFEMLMYSIGEHSSYVVDFSAKTITATGRMRSITRVASLVLEDTLHDFIAVAVDNQPGILQPNRGDRFDIHFRTDFWRVGNPLCTPSDRVIGGCRFGGKTFLGDVVVSSTP
jgi:hypothetical protein